MYVEYNLWRAVDTYRRVSSHLAPENLMYIVNNCVKWKKKHLIWRHNANTSMHA